MARGRGTRSSNRRSSTSAGTWQPRSRAWSSRVRSRRLTRFSRGACGGAIVKAAGEAAHEGRRARRTTESTVAGRSPRRKEDMGRSHCARMRERSHAGGRDTWSEQRGPHSKRRGDAGAEHRRRVETVNGRGRRRRVARCGASAEQRRRRRDFAGRSHLRGRQSESAGAAPDIAGVKQRDGAGRRANQAAPLPWRAREDMMVTMPTFEHHPLAAAEPPLDRARDQCVAQVRQ